MSAIYRMTGQRITIYPTKNLPAGTIVALSSNLVGVVDWNCLADQPGQISLLGVYDVEIAAGKAYAIGDVVTATAVTLAGTSTTAKVGLAVAPVTTTDTTARVILLGPQAPAASA